MSATGQKRRYAGNTAASSFYAQLSATVSGPATDEQRKRTFSGGTSVYALVVGNDFKRTMTITQGKNAGNTFNVYSFIAILGMPDRAPEEGIQVDELTNEIVFRMRDPAHVLAGQNSDPKIPEKEIPRTVEARYRIGQDARVEINNCVSLPGNPQMPCLVRLNGLMCRPWKHNPSNTEWQFSLSAGNAYVTADFANSPSALISFARKIVPFSECYHECPLYTESELKGRPHPKKKGRVIMPPRNGPLQIFPVIMGTDSDELSRALGVPDPDKGRNVFFFDKMLATNWFFRFVNGQWDKIPATQDTCSGYNITVRLPLRIMQWDTSVDPRQRMPAVRGELHHTAQYEVMLTVWPQRCWTFGVSHPIGYYVLSNHIKFMHRSMVFFWENRHSTSKVEANQNRQNIVASQGGVPTDTTMLTSADVGSYLVDIVEYLERVGLPVSFKGACKILGRTFTDTGEIICSGDKGIYRSKEGVENILKFENADVVCLNEYSGDLRKVQERSTGFRVLSGFVPHSVKVCTETLEPVVSKMTDDDVISVCELSRDVIEATQACRAARGDNIPLAVQYIEACLHASLLPPQVFAILGPQSDEERIQIARGRELLLRQWNEGPSIISHLGVDTLNAPAEDELDIVPTLPPSAKRQRIEPPQATVPVADDPPALENVPMVDDAAAAAAADDDLPSTLPIEEEEEDEEKDGESSSDTTTDRPLPDAPDPEFTEVPNSQHYDSDLDGDVAMSE